MIPYAHMSYHLIRAMRNEAYLPGFPAGGSSEGSISLSNYQKFLDHAVAFTEAIEPYLDNYTGTKKPLGLIESNKARKDLDKAWKSTFEKPVHKKAKSKERSFLPIRSELDLQAALRFHWYFSQITTFCQISTDPAFRNGFAGISPPRGFGWMVDKVLKKSKQTISNRLERIDVALRACGFPLAHEYLRQVADAKRDERHPLQDSDQLPYLFASRISASSMGVGAGAAAGAGGGEGGSVASASSESIEPRSPSHRPGDSMAFFPERGAKGDLSGEFLFGP